MATPVTLDAAMLDLSYLLGETSVPSPEPPDRMAFIQRTLERVYRSYNFDFSDNITTSTLTAATEGGAITLPTDIGQDPAMDVRVLGVTRFGGSTMSPGDDLVFTKIPYEQQDSYGVGDLVYWLTGAPGNYVLNTPETPSTIPWALTIRYSMGAPVINSSIATNFPSSMILAQGALIYYRIAEDPQADVSQLEAQFQNELNQVVAQELRHAPDHPAITRQQVRGTYTGDIDITYFPGA